MTYLNKIHDGRYFSSSVAIIQMPGWGVDTPPLALAVLSAFLMEHNVKVMPIDFNGLLYSVNKEKYPQGWSVGISNFWSNPSLVDTFIQDNREVLDCGIDAIIDTGVKIVGFTLYDSSMLMSFRIAEEIKARDPETLIVSGGGAHASDYMAGKHLLDNLQYVDVVVEGEGENALLEIVGRVEDGKSLENLAGARARVAGEVSKGLPRPLMKKLDDLPYPDFSDFDLSVYKWPNTLPIESSRGCINRCIFCNERPYWERFRFKNGERMFNEVKHQLDRYSHANFFMFNDSLCNGNIKALRTFAELIVSNGIKIQ